MNQPFSCLLIPNEKINHLTDVLAKDFKMICLKKLKIPLILTLHFKLSPFQIDIYTFKGHDIIIICYVLLDDQLVISIHKLD